MIGRSGYRNLISQKDRKEKHFFFKKKLQVWSLIHDQRLFKPGDIDEESEEGEECGRQTDDGSDSYEVADQGELLLAEEHGGARGRAVFPAHECVTQVRLNLQLSGAPEPIISLDSHG